MSLPLMRNHLLRVLILCFCVLFITPITFIQTVFAATDPITVTSQTDKVSFPTGIDFNLKANDTSSNITQAIITIRFPLDNQIEMHSVYPSKPAQSIALQWHEDTSDQNYLPPGSLISYSWELLDSAGNSHTDKLVNFKTFDSRFSWQHLSKGLLTVNWYSGNTDFGQTLLSKADDNIAHISSVLGSGLLHSIDLWVYASDADFHSSLPPNTAEWVGGIAFPELDEAFIVASASTDDTLIRDMPHEFTHLVFHQLISSGIQAPTWFDEGLAVYNQIYHESEMKLRLNQALARNGLLRLDTITLRFPGDSDQAYLAYAQSWNLVSYMYTTFGSTKMSRLIHDMNAMRLTFNQDLVDALGVDQIHLENQWRLSLGQPSVLSPDDTSANLTPTPTPHTQSTLVQTTDYNYNPLLILLGLLMIVGASAGIVAIIVLQRRRQQRILAVQAAQQIIASNMYYSGQGQAGPPPYMPYTHPNQNNLPYTHPNQNNLPYTNPNLYNLPYTYPASGQPQPPFPGRPVQPPMAPRLYNAAAEQAFGAPGPLGYPVPPASPQPQPFPTQPMETGKSQENGVEGEAPAPLRPNQEYIDRQPGKQVSQE